MRENETQLAQLMECAELHADACYAAMRANGIEKEKGKTDARNFLIHKHFLLSFFESNYNMDVEQMYDYYSACFDARTVTLGEHLT